VPRSPPFFADGHRETFLATAPNFSPLSSRALMFFASVSVLTSMCAVNFICHKQSKRHLKHITFTCKIEAISTKNDLFLQQTDVNHGKNKIKGNFALASA
jgi:hypothetical protein